MGSIFMDLGLKEFLRDKDFSIQAEIIELEEKFMIARVENDFVIFVNEEKYLGPMTMAVEDIDDFRTIKIKEGDTVSFKNNHLILSKEKDIDYSDVEVIDIRLTEKMEVFSEQIVEKNLLHLEEFLYRYGGRTGMIPIIFNLGDYIKELKPASNIKMYNNMYTSLIYPRFISLFEKLIQGRFDKVEFCTRDIIEFGTENNEHSNGFLLGLLTSFVYGGQSYDIDKRGIIALNELLMNWIDEKTENLYKNILIEAIDGGSHNIISSVVIKIVSESDFDSLDKDLKQLLLFDRFSGTDIIGGIYMGIKLLEQNRFRESLKNLCQVE
ncbi:MAG: hypothetical protein Q4P31_05970 [Andreesenia angusta]|nr:hypothetical protein [Andreesenia angusta]